MGFKFRVLINFARIYFRGSLISHFFFSIAKNAKLCIPIRNIIKPICVSVSLCHPHTFHARFEFWQNYFNVTQRHFYSTQNVKKVSSHQRRKTTIFLNNKSSASLEKLGSKKLNKQKNVTPLRGLYFELLNKETKQIIENEATDRASVQIRFCSQFSFSCSSCSLPAPLSSFL